jgi:hypothetical protein
VSFRLEPFDHLTISTGCFTAEANSPQILEKFLEQALFELNLSGAVDYGYQQALSKTTTGEHAGTLGS